MSNIYKWDKVFEERGWVNYCTSHDLPQIISLKNGKYKVDTGKASRIESTWEAAVRYAVAYGKRKVKEIRKFKKTERQMS